MQSHLSHVAAVDTLGIVVEVRDLPTWLTFNTLEEWTKHELDGEPSRRWSIATDGTGVPDSYTAAAV